MRCDSARSKSTTRTMRAALSPGLAPVIHNVAALHGVLSWLHWRIRVMARTSSGVIRAIIRGLPVGRPGPLGLGFPLGDEVGQGGLAEGCVGVGEPVDGFCGGCGRLALVRRRERIKTPQRRRPVAGNLVVPWLIDALAGLRASATLQPEAQRISIPRSCLATCHRWAKVNCHRWAKIICQTH